MKAITIIALFAVIGSGAALQCFVCNSNVDSSCNDPFSADSPALIDAFLQRCENKTGMETFCRKNKMWLNGETRVHRDCAYKRREHYDCYQQRADDHVVDVCQCDGDSCNAAGRFVPMSTASGALVAAVVAAALARF